MDDNATEQQQTFIEQASDIVSAYVSNNSVPISELPGLLAGVHAALTKLSAPAATVTRDGRQADAGPDPQVGDAGRADLVHRRQAVQDVKRHLSRNGLTIEQYRERFGLPRDYPSTAASYSAQRSELAPQPSASASSAASPLRRRRRRLRSPSRRWPRSPSA